MGSALFPNKRLLNIRELMDYTGLGESKAKRWAREIGAAIDKSIDELARQEA